MMKLNVRSFRSLFLAAVILISVSCQSVKKPDVGKTVTTDDAALVIARYTAEKSSERLFHTVVVFRFTGVGGKELRYANLLTERVITRLKMSRNIAVVNREPGAQSARHLPDLTLSETPEQIRELGREWGADAIVTGQVREGRTFNEISAILLDTRSGKGIGDLAVIESIENYRLGTDQGP